MIHVFSVDHGPWIDLDEVVAISRAHHTEAEERITVLFSNGAEMEWIDDIGFARALGQAWIEHRMQQDEPGRQPRKRTL